VACNFNCCIETEGLQGLRELHTLNSGNISEMVQDRGVVTADH